MKRSDGCALVVQVRRVLGSDSPSVRSPYKWLHFSRLNDDAARRGQTGVTNSSEPCHCQAPRCLLNKLVATCITCQSSAAHGILQPKIDPVRWAQSCKMK